MNCTSKRYMSARIIKGMLLQVKDLGIIYMLGMPDSTINELET